MSERRPIDAEIQGTGGDAGEGGEADGAPSGDALRDAFARRASGVAVVAVRDGSDVHATTVTSFIPVSVDPPLLLVSVGGNAQVLPFLDDDARFVVNVLGAEQRRLATVFSDPYPVGPSPFPPEGAPVLEESLATFTCRVASVVPTEGGRLVLGSILSCTSPGAGPALVHFRRSYRRLDPPD